MEKTTIKSRNIVGIAIRTCNQDQQAATDIPGLWERFWGEDILNKIPNKVNNDQYCVYTEYDGDFTQPYTTLIGCETPDLDHIPEGMKGITIEGGEYMKLTACGKLSDGIVVQEWSKVWQSGLSRAYKADFEVYKAEAFDPDNAEIDIFVGIK